MSQLLRTILLSLLLATSTATFAATFTLSGGPSSGDSLGNDDEIFVFVNGVQVGYGNCCDSSPISFSAEPGDSLRVAVNDSGGGCIALRPLYLHQPQGFTIIDAVGAPQQCPDNNPSSAYWYDQTYTVPGIMTVPTLSEWSMILNSSVSSLRTAPSPETRGVAVADLSIWPQ